MLAGHRGPLFRRAHQATQNPKNLTMASRRKEEAQCASKYNIMRVLLSETYIHGPNISQATKAQTPHPIPPLCVCIGLCLREEPTIALQHLPKLPHSRQSTSSGNKAQTKRTQRTAIARPHTIAILLLFLFFLVSFSLLFLSFILFIFSKEALQWC